MHGSTGPTTANTYTQDSAVTSKILVIEDEVDIANLLDLHLQDLNAQVTTVHDGKIGLERALQEQWDAILLDLRLPSMDGLDVCKTLRANACYTPIMMITSRDTELDRVLGLEIGADDYLAKPFSVAEVKARVKALIRRTRLSRESSEATVARITVGALQLDQTTRHATLNDQPLELTAKEFELLWYFAAHPGRVFKRTELLDKVWGYGHDGYEHTVNSHINRLRSKLAPLADNHPLIETVWGVGYRLNVS